MSYTFPTGSPYVIAKTTRAWRSNKFNVEYREVEIEAPEDLRDQEV